MTKGGNEYILDLDPSASIHDVKQFFQIYYSLNSERITIIYHNRILSDSETLLNFVDSILPGLYIISDEIKDLVEEIEFDQNSISPTLDINLDAKPKPSSKKNNTIIFHRLSSSEASKRNLLNSYNSKIYSLSKLYPDNFTSFKVIVINSKSDISYSNFNAIPVNIVTTEFSKTIGEALKAIVARNSTGGFNSLNNYFILRSITRMTQHSRLYEYNLHQSSIIFLNCESFLPKRINLIVVLLDQNPKMSRKISYNVPQDANVLEFKKIVARDFFRFQEPNLINLFASQNNIMVDDRRIIDYNFLNNSNIKVMKSDLDVSNVYVVIERISGNFYIKTSSKSTIHEFKKIIAKRIKIDLSKQVLLYNHQMIIKEYQLRLSKLSSNKVFSIQLRTKYDPMYGVEFETGLIYYFDVKDDQNVLSLKIQIRDIMNIPASHICLIYNNKTLEDQATMGELSINYFSIITCKKQGFYENIQIRIKTPFLFVPHFISPHTYVTDITDFFKQQNIRKNDEKVNICIPILLFDQNTKVSQIEHCQDTRFVLCEKRSNSFIVTIKTIYSGSFYLPVFPEMTVRSLISLVQLLLNVDSHVYVGSLRLMCYGIILRETYTLAQYQIKPDYIIDAYLDSF